MIFKHLAIGAAAAIIASGCATPRTMTQAEWDLSLTRTFHTATRDQVLAAARNVLQSADPADFRFAPTEDGLQATREWSWFLLIAATRGWDTWTVTTKETPTGVRARVHLSVVTSDINGAVVNGVAMPITTTGQTPTVDGTAIYDLFWARVEYLLGQRDAWMTCADSNARQKSGIVWGSNEPLCDSLTTTDPPAPEHIVKR